MSMPNYYEVLGVSKDVSPNELKRIYFLLVRAYHPDSGAGKIGEERLKQINEAYAVLKDPVKRDKYDNLLKSQSSDHAKSTSDQNVTSSQTASNTAGARGYRSRSSSSYQESGPASTDPNSSKTSSPQASGSVSNPSSFQTPSTPTCDSGIDFENFYGSKEDKARKEQEEKKRLHAEALRNLVPKMIKRIMKQNKDNPPDYFYRWATVEGKKCIAWTTHPTIERYGSGRYVLLSNGQPAEIDDGPEGSLIKYLDPNLMDLEELYCLCHELYSQACPKPVGKIDEWWAIIGSKWWEG